MTATALLAADLVLDRKGILAADESGPAMDARLRRAGVAPGAQSRRAYREMLVTTPGLSLGISGVILGDETFRARMSDGRSFPEALAAWHGDPACAAAGQRALAHRVACNVAALQGRYTAVLEPSYVLAGYA